MWDISVPLKAPEAGRTCMTFSHFGNFPFTPSPFAVANKRLHELIYRCIRPVASYSAMAYRRILVLDVRKRS